MFRTRILSPLLVLAFLAAGPPLIAAQELPAAISVSTVDGKITAVEKDRQGIRLRNADGKELSFTLVKHAAIDVAGTEGNRSDLREGQGARVSYRLRDGIRLALLVRAGYPLNATTAAEPGAAATQAAVNLQATIVEMKPDFSQLTLRPAGIEEDLTLFIDEQFRSRLRNRQVSVTDFASGREVRVICVASDGKNWLTSLRDEHPATPADMNRARIDQLRQTLDADHLLSGRIVRIQKDLMVVMTRQGDLRVLMTPGSQQPMLIDDATTIQLEGKSARLEELREGTMIQVSFEQRNGQRHVRSIDAGSTQSLPTGSASPRTSGNGQVTPPVPQEQGALGAAATIALQPPAEKPAPTAADDFNTLPASLYYFQSATSLLKELRARRVQKIQESGQLHMQYANRIAELPILNVDPELLAWGTKVSNLLRDAGTTLQAAAYRNNAVVANRKDSLYVQQPSITTHSYYRAPYYYGAPYAYYFPPVYYWPPSWTAFGNYWYPYYWFPYDTYYNPGVIAYDNNFTEVWAAGRANTMDAATERAQAWKEIDDSTDGIRKAMTLRYKTEFY